MTQEGHVRWFLNKCKTRWDLVTKAKHNNGANVVPYDYVM